jgi:hypothetical protein
VVNSFKCFPKIGKEFEFLFFNKVLTFSFLFFQILPLGLFASIEAKEEWEYFGKTEGPSGKIGEFWEGRIHFSS